MNKVVELKLDGDLELGLQANLAISPEGKTREVEISGELPPAPLLLETYNLWQYNYYQLNSTSRIVAKKITYDRSIQEHKLECFRLVKHLKKQLNNWLNSPQFQPIWRKFIEKTFGEETIRILIRTRDKQLRKLPWHLWELLEKYPNAEIALAANDYEKITNNRTVLSQRGISILAILGNSSGIDIEEDKQLLTKILNNAELTFLCEPKREEISAKLWEKKWDILFFAGHSKTESETGRIYINSEDSLSLEELSYALKKAVASGLKLAIFNSCDGLGLANYLEELNFPQIIVMREPVPDRVAQQFLKYFLIDFASGKHFYLAVRDARERLQVFEDKFPGATWLPIIVQNPGIIFPTWLSLGGINLENNSPISQDISSIHKSRRKVLKYGSLLLGGMCLSALATKILKPSANQTTNNQPKKFNFKLAITPVKKLQISGGEEIWSLAISPDERLIVSGSNRGTIEFFDRQTGESKQILDLHKNVIRTLVFQPKTERLISGDGDGNIKIWQQENQSLVSELQAHSGSIWSLAVSPDGGTLISSSQDRTVKIWNLETQKKNGIIFAHNAIVYAVVFSDDGKIFASAGADKIVKIWDAKNRKLLKALQGHQDAVRSLAITFDSKYIISGSWDSTVKIWEIASGNLVHTFEGHQENVVTLTVSKNSKIVFSGSTDNMIKAWQIKDGKLLANINNQNNWVLALASSKEENFLVSGGKNDSLSFWQYKYIGVAE